MDEIEKLKRRCEDLKSKNELLEIYLAGCEEQRQELEKELRRNAYAVVAFFDGKPCGEPLAFKSKKLAEAEAQILLEDYASVYIFNINPEKDHCWITRATPQPKQ